MNARIGVDLGGTKIEAAVLAPDRTILARRRVPTPAGDYEKTVETVAALVRDIGSPFGKAPPVGIGTPGSASSRNGRMRNCNSTVLNGRPLQRDLEFAIGRSIRMANDADCFTMSEALDGAGADARFVFGVILGTGVGGGFAFEGRAIGGRNGIAGEWGHTQLPWRTADEIPGPRCYCGNDGCIETFLSGPALARDRERLGDAEALDRYEHRLARALAQVVDIADPDAIVLGGGVSNVSRLYERVPPLLGARVFSDTFETPLRKAAHGDSSGVRGAALLWPA